MVLSTDRWINKVAIVTGASAGIGKSIAEHLVDKGLIVAGFARRTELVEELSKTLSTKKGKLYAVKCDITNEEDILKSFEWVKKNLGPIHILINNAGLAIQGKISNGKTEQWRNIFDLNVIGLSVCCREAIQDMTKNNVDGHIININSIYGHNVTSGMSLGPASKFSVTAITEILRQEFNEDKLKIKVTSISPGLVSTETVEKSFKEYLTSTPYLDPNDVSDAVIYALSTPPHVQIHEITLTALTFINNI